MHHSGSEAQYVPSPHGTATTSSRHIDFVGRSIGETATLKCGLLSNVSAPSLPQRVAWARRGARPLQEGGWTGVRRASKEYALYEFALAGPLSQRSIQRE